MIEKKELNLIAELPAVKKGKVQMKKTVKALKEFGYEKPVNKDPLVDMPKPEIFFYRAGNRYFFTEYGLEDYCVKNNIPMSSTYRVEYYREFAGCKDVLKINEKYYTAIDENCVAMYDYDRSVYLGYYNWNIEYGYLREEYQILKNVEITLENDVYGDIDKRNNKMKSLKNNNL